MIRRGRLSLQIWMVQRFVVKVTFINSFRTFFLNWRVTVFRIRLLQNVSTSEAHLLLSYSSVKFEKNTPPPLHISKFLQDYRIRSLILLLGWMACILSHRNEKLFSYRETFYENNHLNKKKDLGRSGLNTVIWGSAVVQCVAKSPSSQLLNPIETHRTVCACVCGRRDCCINKLQHT